MGGVFAVMADPAESDASRFLETPPMRALSPNLLFLTILLIACTTSGGVILGTGAFSAKAQEEELLSSDDVDVVANFAFQMLTWITLLWSVLHDSLGPRGCAVLGLLSAAGGHLILALASTHGFTSPYTYAVGLGLVGGGGMGAYISSFQFLNLEAFQRTRGFRTSLLAAAFNVAAYPLLLLNVGPISLGAFFYGYGAFALCAAAVSALLFPDRPYDAASTPRVSGPPRCLSGVCPGLPELRGGNGVRGCSKLVVQTWRDLRAAGEDLRTLRYWGFCLTFSWAALTQEWAGSAVGSGLLFPHADDSYLQYAVPLISNATYLFAPLVGWLIDATGFLYASLLLVVAMQCTCVTLWIGSAIPGAEGAMQWLSLLLIAALAAIVYTIQYAYLTMTFKPASYPGLLATALIVQGSLGFLAWPVLSEVHPFGCADPCMGNFIMVLAPSVILYAWPLWELLLRWRKLRESLSASGSAAPPVNTTRVSSSSSLPVVLGANTLSEALNGVPTPRRSD